MERYFRPERFNVNPNQVTWQAKNGSTGIEHFRTFMQHQKQNQMIS